MGNSIKWVTIIGGMRFFLRLISVVVLARIISPQDYGLFTSGLLISSFATIFIDGSFGNYLIFKDRINTKTASSVAFVAGLFAIVIYSIIFFSSTTYEALIGIPDSSIVVEFLALTFILRALCISNSSLAQRHQEFFKLSIVELVSYIFSLALAIPLALKGYGIISLVVMHLSNEVARVILFWFSKPMSFKFDFHESLDTLKSKYAQRMIINGIINNMSLQASNFLIGMYLGVEALGYYSRMFYLAAQPANFFTLTISRVLFANFARHKNDDIYIKSIILSSANTIFLLVMPISILLYFLRVDVVNLVLGDNWIEGAQVFGLLFLTIPARLFWKTIEIVYKGRGDLHVLLFLNLFFLASVVFGIWSVRDGTIDNVAFAICIVYWINAILSFCFFCLKLNTSRSFLLRVFGMAISGSIPISLAFLILQSFNIDYLAVAMLSYFLSMILVFPKIKDSDLFVYLRSMLASRLT